MKSLNQSDWKLIVHYRTVTNSDWMRDVSNHKKDGPKIVKNLFFRTALLILFYNYEGKCPQITKMSLFKSGIRV